MEDRRGDKIVEIEKFLEELESALPKNLDDYLSDFKIKVICERYFEKIVEAIVDLGFLIIKDNKFKIPEDDESSFEILKKEGVVSEEICEKMRKAKGMRNIIAHEYGKIDDERVFRAVTEELIEDVRNFLKEIENAK